VAVIEANRGSLAHLSENSMSPLPLDPDVADLAPTEAVLTAYDEEHIAWKQTIRQIVEEDSPAY
jgi:hypothetical protein